MINILGKTVAQGVGSVVEKAVSEAVKPAVTKFAQKQADLIDSVSREIESASESMNCNLIYERNYEKVDTLFGLDSDYISS